MQGTGQLTASESVRSVDHETGIPLLWVTKRGCPFGVSVSIGTNPGALDVVEHAISRRNHGRTACALAARSLAETGLFGTLARSFAPTEDPTSHPLKGRFTTRLAPSPTGAIHLGNARTFGITWWWARACEGRLVLRIEDIDSPRKKPGAIEELRADLAWLGLDWDAELPIQSSRQSRHAAILRDLLARDLVYPCACTRRDVEEAQSAPHEAPGDLVYPGTCALTPRSLDEALSLGDRPVALRFRSPREPITFRDAIHGDVTIDLASRSGDFVVGRACRGGALEPGYQLAVVVDDADDAVTSVIRGDDLLISAARQMAIQRALGLPPVTYAHVPLVVGADGRRLAKRHGDTRLSTLRASGVSAERVWRWIAGTLGRPFQSVQELVHGGFDPAWVPRAAVVTPARSDGTIAI